MYAVRLDRLGRSPPELVRGDQFQQGRLTGWTRESLGSVMAVYRRSMQSILARAIPRLRCAG
jgi:hypothetical protein